MGTYRIWPSTNGPASVVGDTTAYTLGTEFYVTALVDFTGYWWWCTPGADTSAKTCGLWQVVTATTGTPVAGAGAVSGPLTQGAWNWIPAAAPVQLTENQRYRAGILGTSGTNWYGATPGAFPADIVHGPLTAPSTANAVGNVQGGYNQQSVLAIPAFTNGSGPSYWLDVQVVDSAAPPTATRTNTRGREPVTTLSGRRPSAQTRGREPISFTGGETP